MKVRDEIVKLWQSRGKDERTDLDAEKVADIAWGMGLRLHHSQHTHYQEVMYLIGHSNMG